MSVIFWNLIIMVSMFLFAFSIGAIFNSKINKLSSKKLKIYLLLIILEAIFISIAACQLEILDRLLIGTLCVSPLLLVLLVALFRLFKKAKELEKDKDYFIFT